MNKLKIKRDRWNPEATKKLADIVAKSLCKMCNYDFESIKEDCEKIFDCPFNRGGNGFELAKEFENKGYKVDAEWVIVLDDLPVYDLSNEIQKTWVDKNSLKIPSSISLDSKIRYKKDGKEIEGIVKKFYHDVYKIGIQTPEQENHRWWLIPFENVIQFSKLKPKFDNDNE